MFSVGLTEINYIRVCVLSDFFIIIFSISLEGLLGEVEVIFRPDHGLGINRAKSVIEACRYNRSSHTKNSINLGSKADREALSSLSLSNKELKVVGAPVGADTNFILPRESIECNRSIFAGSDSGVISSLGARSDRVEGVALANTVVNTGLALNSEPVGSSVVDNL